MSSRALQDWQLNLQPTAASWSVVQGVPAREADFAFIVSTAGHFQAFCRNLHSECSDHAVQALAPLTQPGHPGYENLLRSLLTSGRKLDQGNAQTASIGADFGRFGIRFWAEVKARDGQNDERSKRLDELVVWRNAIADRKGALFASEQDTARASQPDHAHAQIWLTACDELDAAMRGALRDLTGLDPWT